MKISLEVEETLSENEIIIRCNSPGEEIYALMNTIQKSVAASDNFVGYKEDREYFLRLNDILFFETEDGLLWAHTKNDMYSIRYKLYELEELLPGFFMRVSKSTILNTHHIYSIGKNITSTSLVQFRNSHKQVYVSRYYYKPLRLYLEERSLS